MQLLRKPATPSARGTRPQQKDRKTVKAQERARVKTLLRCWQWKAHGQPRRTTCTIGLPGSERGRGSEAAVAAEWMLDRRLCIGERKAQADGAIVEETAYVAWQAKLQTVN